MSTSVIPTDVRVDPEGLWVPSCAQCGWEGSPTRSHTDACCERHECAAPTQEGTP